MSARFATDDPASMLPSLPDTAEVGPGQRQPRDGDRRRCSCVDTGAPDDGSDDVHGNNHRRTTFTEVIAKLKQGYHFFWTTLYIQIQDA